MSDDKRSSIMAKVRGLIAKADSTDFPAEADAFRAQADALMLKYSIASFELKDESQSSRAVDPRDYDMSWYSTHTFGQELWEIMQAVAHHCRVVMVGWKFTGLTIPAVGTADDIDYFDLLFTNVQLEMSKGIEPKPRDNEAMVEYLVRAKEAGMKWERMADIMLQYDIAEFAEYTRNVGVRFTKLYTDYCKEHNRPRLRVQPTVYQRSFVEGFKLEIVDRLLRIRRESERMYAVDSDSSGTDLVLADMRRVVDARTHQLFGHAPQSYFQGGGRRDTRKIDQGGVTAGRAAAAEVGLGNRSMGATRRELTP